MNNETKAKPESKIEFDDVMAYIESGEISKNQCQQVYDEIKYRVDIRDEVGLYEVEYFIKYGSDSDDRQEIFDRIKGDINLEGNNNLLIASKSLLDEMAISKIRDFVQFNGIQALAEKL